MKAVSPAFAAMLESGQRLVAADFYILTLASGPVYRWTSAQRPLTIAGVRYEVGPVISRDKLSAKIGLGVDELHVTLDDAGDTLINGLTLATAARRGKFDGATLEVRRWLSPAWAPTGGPRLAGTDDWAAGTLNLAEVGDDGSLQLIRPAPRATSAGDTRVTDAGDERYTN